LLFIALPDTARQRRATATDVVRQRALPCRGLLQNLHKAATPRPAGRTSVRICSIL